jgi:hypothetical protein
LWLQVRAGDAIGPFLAGYATVGALVAARHPRNAVGWLLILFALATTLRTGAETYVGGAYPGWLTVAWLAELLSFVPLVLVLLVSMVFPDGRLPSRRWRPVLWLGAAAVVGFMVGTAFKPGALEDITSVLIEAVRYSDPPLDLPVTTVHNPLGVQGPAGQVFAGVGRVGVGLLVLTVFLVAVLLAVRFRRSQGVERQQRKWFTFAVMLMLASFTVGEASDRLGPGWAEYVNGVAWTLLLLNAIFGIPLAVAVAIFRYHLYDIDLVINRTLVYGALTAALLATYAGSVVLLGRVLAPVVGGSSLAVAGSTLAVAALFHPVRNGIQRAVDRTFYRRRYDAARTLDLFAERLRHELDLEAVGADLCAVAEETLQPSHVSLWLRP